MNNNKPKDHSELFDVPDGSVLLIPADEYAASVNPLHKTTIIMLLTERPISVNLIIALGREFLRVGLITESIKEGQDFVDLGFIRLDIAKTETYLRRIHVDRSLAAHYLDMIRDAVCDPTKFKNPITLTDIRKATCGEKQPFKPVAKDATVERVDELEKEIGKLKLLYDKSVDGYTVVRSALANIESRLLRLECKLQQSKPIKPEDLSVVGTETKADAEYPHRRACVQYFHEDELGKRSFGGGDYLSDIIKTLGTLRATAQKEEHMTFLSAVEHDKLVHLLNGAVEGEQLVNKLDHRDAKLILTLLTGALYPSDG